MCVILVGVGDLGELQMFFDHVKSVKGYSITREIETEITNRRGFFLGFSRAPSENESVGDGDYLQPFEFDGKYHLLFHGVLPSLNEPDATYLTRTFREFLETYEGDIEKCVEQLRNRFPHHGAFIGVTHSNNKHSTVTIACAPSFLPIYVYRMLGSYVICNITPTELRMASIEAGLYYYVEPYTVKTFSYNIKSGCMIFHDALRTHDVEVQDQDKSVLISFSGGMDCVATVLALFLSGYRDFHAVHFQYGQPEIETKRAEVVWATAGTWFLTRYPKHGLRFGALKVIDLTSIPTFDTSQLKTGIGEGESEMETAARYVPQRNLQFLSFLAALAERWGIKAIAFGANLTEGMVYPDNSAQFIHLMTELLKVSGVKRIKLHAPLATFTKAEIVAFCKYFGYDPIEKSWSCYTNESTPCGKCGSCFARNRAFERAAQVPERRVEEIIRLIKEGSVDDTSRIHLACV